MPDGSLVHTCIARRRSNAAALKGVAKVHYEQPSCLHSGIGRGGDRPLLNEGCGRLASY